MGSRPRIRDRVGQDGRTVALLIALATLEIVQWSIIIRGGVTL